MNPTKLIKHVTLPLIFSLNSWGALFSNLDFESATVVPNDPSGSLDWNLAVPDWSHSTGDDTARVYHEFPHVGTTQFFLLADSATSVSPLAGQYSLVLRSGHQFGNDLSSPWVNAYISQEGSIPVYANSLQMLAIGSFQVMVDGVNIPMISLGGDLYEGDISQYSGAMAEIKIINSANDFDQSLIVDNITFIIVPEPSSLGLVLMSAILVIRRRSR
ncbi:PEP-CTERM sorting domain-containing protein [Akkermansiaceae bacterium]|nr:PEP-CTERM sorting domain-containing protein [Akkermansiaceae bacterium]